MCNKLKYFVIEIIKIFILNNILILFKMYNIDSFSMMKIKFQNLKLYYSTLFAGHLEFLSYFYDFFNNEHDKLILKYS